MERTNKDILEEIRRRILTSEYWRVRLFSNIRGYSFTDLKLVADKTYKTENGLQAKIEHLRVWSMAFPYLVYGSPIITNSAKETAKLKQFLAMAEREGEKAKKKQAAQQLTETITR